MYYNYNSKGRGCFIIDLHDAVVASLYNSINQFLGLGFFVSLEDFLNSYGDVKAKKNVLCLESLRLPPSVVQLLYRVLSN